MKSVNFTSDTLEPELSGIDFSALQWMDFDRTEPLSFGPLDAVLHAKHLDDLRNSQHPPYFEQTEDYELLVFRALDTRYQIHEPRTRAIAFLMVKNTVITVHDADDESLEELFTRLSHNRKIRLDDTLSLLHYIFDEIVNQYVKIREPLDRIASEWQQKLLDPDDPFKDWQTIVRARSKLRAFNTTLDLQGNMLRVWQEETQYQLSGSHTVIFNDVIDHLARIERLTNGIRSDLDSLAQVYFASTGQQTNSNVQILAIISAIFLPLNLIAGIFGMNFNSVPFLDSPYGPYAVLAVMLLLSFLLLWLFKIKRWF